MLNDTNHEVTPDQPEQIAKPKPKGWTPEELKAAVIVYQEIDKRQRAGEKISKASFYRALAEKHERSAKSFEYRMQNISHVYTTMGREYAAGLKPASNVGKNVVAQITGIIKEVENQ